MFITLTCNENSEEIKNNLFIGQKCHDRKDLTSRVYKMKSDLLYNLIKKREIFGKIKAIVSTLEFQKRGLPHTHLLLWLHNEIYKKYKSLYIFKNTS